MSRIGKLPIKIPGGVTVSVDSGLVTVTGPKGSLTRELSPGLSITQTDDILTVARDSEEQQTRAKHGLMRALIANMVQGVTEGFSKKLEVVGVGFKVALAGGDLKLSLGYSHEVIYNLPAGVQASVEQNTVVVSGMDKQAVGQVAAEIRELRKPEPYKGKGIKYAGERILRKSGKSGKEKA